MSLKSSGLWCDLCGKPIFHDPYWNCSVNGKPGHACDKCKAEYKKAGVGNHYDKKPETPSPEDEVSE